MIIKPDDSERKIDKNRLFDSSSHYSLEAATLYEEVKSNREHLESQFREIAQCLENYSECSQSEACTDFFL